MRRGCYNWTLGGVMVDESRVWRIAGGKAADGVALQALGWIALRHQQCDQGIGGALFRGRAGFLDRMFVSLRNRRL